MRNSLTVLEFKAIISVSQKIRQRVKGQAKQSEVSVSQWNMPLLMFAIGTIIPP